VAFFTRGRQIMKRRMFKTVGGYLRAVGPVSDEGAQRQLLNERVLPSLNAGPIGDDERPVDGIKRLLLTVKEPWQNKGLRDCLKWLKIEPSIDAALRKVERDLNTALSNLFK